MATQPVFKLTPSRIAPVSAPSFAKAPVAPAPTLATRTSTPATSITPKANPIAQSSSPFASASPIGSVSYTTSNSTPATGSALNAGSGYASSPLSGALGAIQRAGSSLASSYSGGQSGSANAYSALSALDGAQANPENPFAGSADTYKGTPGTSYSTFAPSIAKGQTSISPDLPTNNPAFQEREANKQILRDAETKRNAEAATLQAQLVIKQKELKDAQVAADLGVSAYNPNKPDSYDPSKDSNVKSLQAQYDAMDKEYQKLLLPSEEELAAKEKEDALAAEEAGVNASLNQKVTDVNKEPVPLGFLQGWGTTFNKDAAAKLQTIGAAKIPIQQQLARLAATRQSAMDVQKQRLNSAKDAVSTAQSIYKERADREDKKNEPFNLSAGQTRYDGNGGILARSAASKSNYTSTNIPSDLKAELLQNAKNVSLGALYDAYPDVSSSYLQSIWNSLHPKSSSGVTNPFE